MIRYIEDIDISFSILIYRIVEKNVKFFDVSQYLLYLTNFSMYHDFLHQKFILLLLHYQNNKNKWRKQQINRRKLAVVS